jgi:hypothetical protein
MLKELANKTCDGLEEVAQIPLSDQFCQYMEIWSTAEPEK